MNLFNTSQNRLIPFLLVERHFPSYVPATEKKQNASRRCVVCWKRETRKESLYECVRCDVGLCAASYFEGYHKLKNF